MNWIKRKYQAADGIARDGKKQRQFLWLVSGILLVFAGIIYYKHGYFQLELIGIAGFSLALSFLYACIVRWPLLVWSLLGILLSEVTSTILLAIVFYLLLLPFSLVKKRNKNPQTWVKIEQKNNFEEMY